MSKKRSKTPAKTKSRGRAVSWEACLKSISAVAFLLCVFFVWRSSSAEGLKREYERAYENYLSLRSLAHQHSVMAITTDSPEDFKMAATVASDAVSTMVLQRELLKDPSVADAKDTEFAKKVLDLLRLKDVSRLEEVKSLSAYRGYVTELTTLEVQLSAYFAKELKAQRTSSEGFQTAFLISQAIGFMFLVAGEVLATFRARAA